MTHLPDSHGGVCEYLDETHTYVSDKLISNGGMNGVRVSHFNGLRNA